MGIKYNKLFVTLELGYGIDTVYAQIHVDVPTTETDPNEIKAAALAAYTHVTGARTPESAWIQDMEVVAKDIQVEPVLKRNVSIHWTEEELDGIDTQGFREQVTEFGNRLIEDNR
jgi:hypothetical protein